VRLLSGISIQGKCIFCGSNGLTKQHVWPNWLKNVIPISSVSRTQSLTRFYGNEKNILIHPDSSYKQGGLWSQKIRNVCAKCNNGWMSRLEEDAKPIISSLINNEEFTLDEGSQRIISTWVAVVSIMAEFTDMHSLSIPEDHRQFIMDNNKTPDGWSIWIGRCKDSSWKERYSHNGFAIVPKELIKCVPNGNTQISAFTIGELFIYIFSTTVPQLFMDIPESLSNKLFCICPFEKIIYWPLENVLNGNEADEITEVFPGNRGNMKFK
jgi:hypothetical protein